MKGKSTIFVLMILGLACMPSFVFAGGSGQQGGAASGPSSADGVVKPGYAVPVSQGGELTDRFTVFKGAVSMSPEETMQQKALREKTGISYVVQGLQSNDVQTALNLMLASGEELADVLTLGRNITLRNALIESGKVMELSFLYNSKTLKTIPNIHEKIKKFITEPDGKMWVLPGTYDINPDDPYPGWTVEAFWIRRDVMQQAGVSEQDLSTLAGFEAALHKFKALKDPSGRPLIPLTFIQSGQGGYPHQENIIIAMFGVDMANGVSGMPPVMEINGKRVFAFENPDYLEAFKWMNRMYNEGLIDIEVTTQKNERFVEKLDSGMFAAFAGHFAQGEWEGWENPPDVKPYRYPMDHFQSPKVPNKTKRAVRYVNPYPGTDIFISKNTKRLNAVANWIEWAQEPVYYRMHEVENGPEGTTWFFVDTTKQTWRFEAEFEKERNSGDSTRLARVYNPLPVYTRNKTWYPWFHQDIPLFWSIGKHSRDIASNIVNHRVINNMDLVQPPTDGVIAANLPTLNQVRDEYTAKMIMAKTPAECEAAYREFLRMLETRANWSGMKAEWEKLYSALK
jgi:putative aldouronate transport system substrate-binding protein